MQKGTAGNTDIRLATKRENTARDGLSLIDRVFAASELRRMHIEAGKPCDGYTLSEQLGISESTFNRYINLVKRLDSSVTTLWRETTVNLTLQDMTEIAAYDKHEQIHAFRTMLASKSGLTVKCTSCDDQGCGFCIPNEPHGQPTE